MIRIAKALAAFHLLVLLGCRQNETPTQALPAETGGVEVSIELGRPGILARAAGMIPQTVVLGLSAPGEPTRSDTLFIVGGLLVLNKAYTLVSGKEWTLSAKGFDQRDSMLYQGSAKFRVVPGGTVSLNLSLDPRHSTLRLRVPLRSGTRRIQLSVDGASWKDTTLSQAVDGDTVQLESDYLTASAQGIPHRIGLRFLGSLRGAETLLYEGDTNIVAISGRDLSAAFSVWWVAPLAPVDGRLYLVVGLGSVGSLQVLAGYAGWSGDVQTLIDPRDGASYRTRDFGGKVWMLDNLGSTCAGCDSGGTRFSAAQLSQACPAGWRLPDTGEWHDLVRFAARGASDSVGIAWLKSKSDWYQWWEFEPTQYANGFDALGFHLVPLQVYTWNMGSAGHPMHMDLTTGRSVAEMWTSTVDSTGENLGAIFTFDDLVLGRVFMANQSLQWTISQGAVRCVSN